MKKSCAEGAADEREKAARELHYQQHHHQYYEQHHHLLGSRWKCELDGFRKIERTVEVKVRVPISRQDNCTHQDLPEKMVEDKLRTESRIRPV